MASEKCLCSCNNTIKEQFQKLLEGGLFCSNHISAAMQLVQEQSISTSE